MARSTSGKGQQESPEGFSELERAALKQRAAELRAESRRAKAADKSAAEAAAVLAVIAAMPDGDRELAERVHRVVTDAAPDLAPKLYYGQPGYARAGRVVCFFRSGQQDKERYSTLGFSAEAGLDGADGLWPTAYALSTPTEQAWAAIGDLVRRAAG